MIHVAQAQSALVLSTPPEARARACLVYLPAVLTIELNGEPHEVAEGTTLAALVAALGLDPRHVAVERNREIVPRAAYPATPLATGDHLEIVTFVGGG